MTSSTDQEATPGPFLAHAQGSVGMESMDLKRPHHAWPLRVIGILVLVVVVATAAWFTKDVFDGRDPQVARHLPAPDRSA